LSAAGARSAALPRAVGNWAPGACVVNGVGPSAGGWVGSTVGDGHAVGMAESDGQGVGVASPIAVGVAVAVPHAPATMTARSATPAPRSLVLPPRAGAPNLNPAIS
jgi:hypothetical protein